MDMTALAKLAHDRYLSTNQRGVLYVRNHNKRVSLSYGLYRDYDLLLYDMMNKYDPLKQAVIDIDGHYLTVNIL